MPIPQIILDLNCMQFLNKASQSKKYSCWRKFINTDPEPIQTLWNILCISLNIYDFIYICHTNIEFLRSSNYYWLVIFQHTPNELPKLTHIWVVFVGYGAMGHGKCRPNVNDVRSRGSTLGKDKVERSWLNRTWPAHNCEGTPKRKRR